MRDVGSDRLYRRFRIAWRIALALLVVTELASAEEPIFSSKWAMDVAEYAEKYGVPYSNDPRIRRTQIRREMFDASFQEDASGVYGGGAGALTNGSVGDLAAGIFKMPTSWSTVRLGALGMVANGQPMGGGEVGVRLHLPTRLAPYVGLGGVLELSGVRRQITRHRYYYDNGNRLDNPRWGYFPVGMAAVVPEAGISYWLTSDARLNLGAGYYITSGRQPDFLMVNMSLGIALRNPDTQTLPPPILEQDDDSDPYFVPTDRFQQRLEQRGQDTPRWNPERLDSDPSPDTFEDLLPRPLSAPNRFVPSPPETLLPTLAPRGDVGE